MLMDILSNTITFQDSTEVMYMYFQFNLMYAI